MSLGIRPLHELFDMYRAHEATEVHDKIFALLGMCSDSSDVLSAGFSLDYTVTWEELASQLTKLWLGPSVTTKVLNDGRKLELEAEGFVLGTLVGVRSDFKTGGQRAEIITPGISNQRLLLGQFPALAMRVKNGDIVCQLSGAPRPTVLRLSRDGKYFNVVTTAIILDENWESVRQQLCSRTGFIHTLSLLWNLQDFQPLREQNTSPTTTEQTTSLVAAALVIEDVGALDKSLRMFRAATWSFSNLEERGYGRNDAEGQAVRLVQRFTEHKTLSPRPRESDPDERCSRFSLDEGVLAAVADMRFLLYGNNRNDLQSALEICVEARGLFHPTTLHMREQVAGHLAPGELTSLSNWVSWFRILEDRILSQGIAHPDVMATLDKTVALLMRHRWDKYGALRLWRAAMDMILGEIPVDNATLRSIFETQTGSLTTLLLHRRGNEINDLAMFMESAARNGEFGDDVMEVLLVRGGDSVSVTEKVVELAAQNITCGSEILSLLVTQSRGRIPVTEEALMAALEFGEYVNGFGFGPTTDYALGRLRLLTDQVENDEVISDNVLSKAIHPARLRHIGSLAFKTLFDKKRAGFEITEQLWWSAVQCASARPLGMLIEKGVDEVRVSELFSILVGQPAAVEKMALLLDVLDRKDSALTVTREFTHAVMKKGCWDLLEYILIRRGNGTILTDILAAETEIATDKHRKRNA